MQRIRQLILAMLASNAFCAQAMECYESSVLKPSPFMGNDGEVFQLADGSLWEVMNEYEYMYEYYPDVIICPDAGELLVDDSRLSIRLLAAPERQARDVEPGKVTPAAPPTALESQIDGEFEGWEGETIVKLVNGQIWQQAVYHYEYHYAYMPPVIVFQSNGVYKMKVDGTSEAVPVIQLR